MSRTQQEIELSKDSAAAKPLTSPVEVGSWEPYLSLINSWQRADEICAKAIERSESTRSNEENRALSEFEAERTRLESGRKVRLENIETERKASKESADRMLAQVKDTQAKVRQAMGTIGLEELIDNIETPAAIGRDESETTLSTLRDAVISSNVIEESLQDDLFDLRAARQRQSAQMWAVGIGLWFVAVLVFAPYPGISALLVALATFVMATPRKIETSQALRPSFSSHIAHCIALLFGQQQVMQYPFSLVEKGRTLSGNALGGAIATGFIAWIFLLMMKLPPGYEAGALAKNLGWVLTLSIIAGAVTFAVSNNDITIPEMNEGDKNKILK